MNLLVSIDSKNQKIINWLNAQNQIFKIQNRIVSQIEKKNFRNARNLQRLLLKSLSAQLIASQKFIEIEYFKDFTLYQIKKKQTFPRVLNLYNYIQFEVQLKNFNLYFNFLKILWLLALIPLHETYSDSFCYNFRLYRDHTDVLKEVVIKLKNLKINWMLIIKPNGFLNLENKQWLINNLLVEKKFLFTLFNQKQLANQLTKEYKYKREFIETKKISLKKIFKNYSLQGYNTSQKTFHKIKEKNLNKSPHLSIIFYNNLLLIPSTNSTQMIFRYRSIFKFLKTRGLSIKKNRIWALNLKDGFTFLGFFFKKQNNNFSITISEQNIRSHKMELKKFLKLGRALSIDNAIYQLNRKIYNWQIYYAYASNLKKTWSEMNHYLFWRIWRWSKKKHKNKGSKWVYKRYWAPKTSTKWVFHFNDQYLRSYNLKKQKIAHLPASINACKTKNAKEIKRIILQKHTISK